MRHLILKLASVSGWRAEEVKRRWRDGWNGIGAQRRRQLLTEADAIAIQTISQDGQAEMLRAGAVLAEASRGISACWSWQGN